MGEEESDIHEEKAEKEDESLENLEIEAMYSVRKIYQYLLNLNSKIDR